MEEEEDEEEGMKRRKERREWNELSDWSRERRNENK